MLIILCLPHSQSSLLSTLLCCALCQEAEPLASCWGVAASRGWGWEERLSPRALVQLLSYFTPRQQPLQGSPCSGAAAFMDPSSSTCAPPAPQT